MTQISLIVSAITSIQSLLGMALHGEIIPSSVRREKLLNRVSLGDGFTSYIAGAEPREAVVYSLSKRACRWLLN